MNGGDGVTLTARVSVFFLATLALVLVSFSTALFFLVRGYVRQQTSEHLEAAVNTLVAEAEVWASAVEWEREAWYRNLASAAPGHDVVWLVRDAHGLVVDRSRKAGTEEFLTEVASTLHAANRSMMRLDWQGESWQCSQRFVPPQFSAKSLPATAAHKQKHGGLWITAAVSLEPMIATMGRLAEILAGLSLGIWLLALFAGRFMCRRALRPVRRMAAAAREMDVEDLERRVPLSPSGDELEDLSRAINNLLDRLQESFQRQKRFTGEASHQLRTPLAVMMGQMEVALRRERPAEDYQRVLATVHRRAGHLHRIVEALLFLARTDAEARLPALEAVDLNAWLPGHLHTESANVRARDIVLESTGADQVPVLVHPALLGDLVNILLDNACKFSVPGTPITVRLYQEPGHVCLQVQDQGCGMSETDLANVFTPFFRSADARRRGIPGTGLGLSIARRLAKAFQAELTVTSQLGLGSRFTLMLPLMAASEERAAAVAAQAG
jgi:signal transduction histidine kinase